MPSVAGVPFLRGDGERYADHPRGIGVQLRNAAPAAKSRAQRAGSSTIGPPGSNGGLGKNGIGISAKRSRSVNRRAQARPSPPGGRRPMAGCSGAWSQAVGDPQALRLGPGRCPSGRGWSRTCVWGRAPTAPVPLEPRRRARPDRPPARTAVGPADRRTAPARHPVLALIPVPFFPQTPSRRADGTCVYGDFRPKK